MDIIYPCNADADWQTWGANFIKLVTPLTCAGLGISTEMQSNIESTFSAFSVALSKAREPATRSAPAVQTKDDALKSFKVAVRPAIAILKTNPDVNDTQRRELGVRIKRQPTPAPVPKYGPMISAFSTGPTTLRIEARDALAPERRAKPEGVRQIETAVKFTFKAGETPDPLLPTDWASESFSGKTTIDLYWPQLSKLATVSTKVRYINTRNLPGPWSEIQSVRLAGTGQTQEQNEQAEDGGGEGMRIAA